MAFGKQQEKNNADFFEGGYVPLSPFFFGWIPDYQTAGYGTSGLIFCIALSIFFVSGARTFPYPVYDFGGNRDSGSDPMAPYRMERFWYF